MDINKNQLSIPNLGNSQFSINVPRINRRHIQILLYILGAGVILFIGKKMIEVMFEESNRKQAESLIEKINKVEENSLEYHEFDTLYAKLEYNGQEDYFDSDEQEKEEQKEEQIEEDQARINFKKSIKPNFEKIIINPNEVRFTESTTLKEALCLFNLDINDLEVNYFLGDFIINIFPKYHPDHGIADKTRSVDDKSHKALRALASAVKQINLKGNRVYKDHLDVPIEELRNGCISTSRDYQYNNAPASLYFKIRKILESKPLTSTEIINKFKEQSILLEQIYDKELLVRGLYKQIFAIYRKRMGVDNSFDTGPIRNDDRINGNDSPGSQIKSGMTGTESEMNCHPIHAYAGSRKNDDHIISDLKNEIENYRLYLSGNLKALIRISSDLKIIIEKQKEQIIDSKYALKGEFHNNDEQDQKRTVKLCEESVPVYEQLIKFIAVSIKKYKQLMENVDPIYRKEQEAVIVKDKTRKERAKDYAYGTAKKLAINCLPRNWSSKYFSQNELTTDLAIKHYDELFDIAIKQIESKDEKTYWADQTLIETTSKLVGTKKQSTAELVSDNFVDPNLEDGKYSNNFVDYQYETRKEILRDQKFIDVNEKLQELYGVFYYGEEQLKKSQEENQQIKSEKQKLEMINEAKAIADAQLKSLMKAKKYQEAEELVEQIEKANEFIKSKNYDDVLKIFEEINGVSPKPAPAPAPAPSSTINVDNVEPTTSASASKDDSAVNDKIQKEPPTALQDSKLTPESNSAKK